MSQTSRDEVQGNWEAALANWATSSSDHLPLRDLFDEKDWEDWAENLEALSESHLEFFEHRLEGEAWEAKATGRRAKTEGALESIVAPFAALLLLSWLERLDTEPASASRSGDAGHLRLFEPDQYWSSWSRLRGKALSDFFCRQLVPALEGAADVAQGSMLRSLAPVLTSFNTIPTALRDRLVHWVACFDMSSATGRKVAQKILTRAVEWETSVFENHPISFSTPAPLAELMVEILDPKPGGRVYDPCFGTGGLLARTVHRTYKGDEGIAGNSGSRSTQGGVFGVEINPHAYVVGAAQAVLAGASDPRLELRDALEGPPRGSESSNGVDYLIAHPPWGHVRPNASQALPVATNEVAMRFLQHAMALLNPGGRAVVALPHHVLYRRGPDRIIRRDLLANYHVEGVIAVPERRWSTHSTAEMSLLVFRRATPAFAVRFLRVPDDLPLGPRDIAVEFRDGQPSNQLWDTPVRDLEMRDWELCARRTGEKALVRKLVGIGKANPKVARLPLEKVADVQAGKSYGDTTTSQPQGESARDVGLLRVADVNDSGIRIPSVFLGRNGEAEVRPESQLRSGDILLTTSGSIGKVGVVGQSGPSAVAGRGIAVIRPSDAISSSFLKCVLASDTYQDWLRGHARGAVIQHLSVAKLRELPVPVPPRKLQERVVRLVAGDRGDPLAAIVRVLANRHDPVVEWLEESVEVRELLGLKGIADGTALLERIAGSLRKLSDEVSGSRIRTLPELTSWLEEVTEPVAALEGLTDIPPGPERLAVLEGLSLRLERIATPGDPPSPATALAHDVTRRISGLAGLERERILADVALEPDIEPSWVAADARNEVQIRVTNRSLLPFRRLEVFTLPKIGEARATYLPAGSTLNVPVRIPSDAQIGPYRFVVQWRAALLNGKQTKGSMRLAVDVRASRPANRVREIGTSPYIVGGPIDRKEMLFGREETIDEICRQLRSDARANVVLLEGNRRTGKTSILKHLQDPEVLPDWLAVNCSLQGGEGHSSKVGLTTNEVFRLMARDLGWAAYSAGIRFWLPDMDPPDPGKPFKVAFVKALRRAFSGDRPFETFELFLHAVIEAARPRRILLMLDEFDKLQEGIDVGVTSPQVPENIRYLLHTYPELSAVLAGSRRIKRLREEYWSALFGFGHRVPVSALPLDDARLLVTRPVDGRLVYVPEARDRVVKLCARQPFLIQSLCNRIFESSARSKKRTVTVDDVEASARAMTEDNEHFRTLWGYAGTERRRFVLALCGNPLVPGPITLRVLERQLRYWGVALRRGERLGDDLEFLRELELLEFQGARSGSAYSLAIPLMAAWIERNVDFEDQRRLAVGEFEEADRGEGYWIAAEDEE